MKKNINFRRSQILTFGSFLIFVGVIVLSFSHLQVLKEEVFEKVRLGLLDKDKSVDTKKESEVIDSKPVENITNNSSTNTTNNNNNSYFKEYNYNYVGYLEIPRIGLKRGFLNKDSKYNNIEYNVTVSEQANYPDERGNFILMAHSGDAYISFFAFLYKLKIGNKAYVTYKGEKYTYQLVKIEEQPKTGVVAIHRPNYDVNGLTLITCTKDSDVTQTIYIFELV